MKETLVKFKIVDSFKPSVKVSFAIPLDYGGRIREILTRAESDMKLSRERFDGIITDLAPYKFANAAAPFWAPRCDPRALTGEIRRNIAMNVSLPAPSGADGVWWREPLINKAFNTDELSLREITNERNRSAVYMLRNRGKYRYANRFMKYFDYCADAAANILTGEVDDVILAERESFRAWMVEVRRLGIVAKRFAAEIEIETRKEDARRLSGGK